MQAHADTTKLEAINEVLLACGQKPVAELGQHLTARQAETLLDKADRSLQSEGWYFNTEREVTLQIDASSSEVPLSPNVISVDSLYACPQYIKRGARLYNIEKRTFAFTSSPTNLEVVYRLEWEEMPQEARAYLVAKVSRQLHAQLVGDRETQASLQLDEFEALTDLQLREAEQSDVSAAPSRLRFREEGSLYY